MASSATATAGPANITIRSGLIVDGSGSAPFESDVTIESGRIIGVAPGSRLSGGRVIDAAGMAVAPGFIDVHTHSDVLPFLDGDHEPLRLAAVRQGVTTEIAGNCGFSVFPCPDANRVSSARRHLETLFGSAAEVFADLSSYAKALRTRALPANVGTLVGHGTLRAATVGFDDRHATTDEIDEMGRLAAIALAQGALGLSSGLLYPPGSYANTAELVTLAAVAARSNRPYVSHVRNEMEGVVAAVTEALDIGRWAGAAVQLSHLKAGGRPNHGRLPDLLARIEEAASEGIEVGADIYPYTAGSTVLHALLPPWATQGGIDATLQRLADPAVRARVKEAFANPAPGWQNFLAGGTWGDVTVASAPRAHHVEGSTIASLAATAGLDPIDLVADLLISQGGSVTVIVEMAAQVDLLACLSSPRTMIGSDGIPVPGKPHPRWAGSFARMLSTGMRAQTGLSLAEAVRKMTSYPAMRYGLSDRGRIAVGAAADVVVFDVDHIEDRATFAHPLEPPNGVRYVLVNGVVTIENGTDCGGRAGVVLDKSEENGSG